MTTKTAWAHLPNAKHIDAVIAFAQLPRVRCVSTWDEVQAVVEKAHDELAIRRTLQVDREILVTATQYIRHPTLFDATWYAVFALIVWDSSADLLDLPPDVLRTMIGLASEPVCHQAALLLPYAIVRAAP